MFFPNLGGMDVDFCEDVNRFSVGVATDESICVEEMNDDFLQIGSLPPIFARKIDQFQKRSK